MLEKFGINISSPTLVLRKFEINKSPKSIADEIISIIGRASGLFGWLLTVIGIDAQTYLTVTGREFEIKGTSLFGQHHDVVPLTSISSTHCGFLKPIGYLILAGVALLYGLFSGLFAEEKHLLKFILCLILGIVFLVMYVMQKKIEIKVQTRGGLSLGLVFKRSVIENVAVDIEQARLAIGILNGLVLNIQNKEIEIQGIVNEAITKTGTKTNRTMPSFCIHCGKTLERGAKFCESCGNKL
jgi:hypothetical protein